MGITGLIPFLEKASRKTNISEFSGCSAAIDTYCWLHKGAFACADKLVRGEETDVHIKYCLKYVSMLLAKNVKPILVFDGRHLPAKAMTEAKRRESRNISKKRAAELLSLGKIEEARSYMRRSVDITHSMALQLIKECRKRNVDCIVAPYEADAQLAYLNVKNLAQVVITEDSDLILFGCTKVLFKMDLDGTGTLVETAKLPLVMKCPIEHYKFDKFRQMCIMSGCDYLASLPGIGLAKARQFITATQDPSITNALRKLPSFFNKSSLTVTDEYRENFLKAEATFKYQYVYDPIERKMVRLNKPEDEDTETALCVNAGELLDPKTAFELALGNIDPFTLKKMDDYHPDYDTQENEKVKTNTWKDVAVSKHPSIWSKEFEVYLNESCPWKKKETKIEPIIAQPQTRARKKVVNLVTKYVPETQDESLTIENLSNMYCVEPANKKQKIDNETLTHTQTEHNIAMIESQTKEITTLINKSPILENKERSYRKSVKNNILKKLSKFSRTVLEDNVVESKFFSTTEVTNNNNCDVKCDIIDEYNDLNSNNDDQNVSKSNESSDAICNSNIIENTNSNIKNESPERKCRNPFRVKTVTDINREFQIDIKKELVIDTQCYEIPDSQGSMKENSPLNSPIKEQKSPILEPSPKVRNMLRARLENICGESEESVIENTYPMEKLVTPVDTQNSFGESQDTIVPWRKSPPSSQPIRSNIKKSNCRVPGLRRTNSLPSNQPTLLSKFGFQKKAVLKR